MSKTLQIMFLEKDGQFSIRKTLAVICAIIFLIACIVSLIWPDKQLPMAYITIIATVFAFYFAKNRLSGTTEVKQEPVVEPTSEPDAEVKK